MIVGGVNLEVASNLSHLESWGMASQVLFNCVEDGLLKLSEGPFWLYVPQLKWTDMRRNIGSSNLYEHLCAPEKSVHSDSLPTREEINASILELLFRFLDVSRNDFLLEVPFTSYGLDSLSAGRLESVALQPFLSVTQLQLLGHMTFPFKWDRLNQSGENVVVLVDGTGIPLILIHGFSGNIVAFMQFQERFSTPLWAIQTTPETPLDSVATTAKYYVEQIKIRGPYRIGEILVQLAMLDHFPTLFTSPSFELDDISLATGQPSRAVVKAVVGECYLRDNSPARHDIARELQRAVEDLIIPSAGIHRRVVVKCMTALPRGHCGAYTITRQRPSGADRAPQNYEVPSSDIRGVARDEALHTCVGGKGMGEPWLF
ncbi:hypothetical protein GGX14DRAFT_635350 [Mycena pura]|uniref:Polyketide synthase n=1 Tax=Mycena pura TaxID=153505 RepID=A0AAD6Y8N8_9AGAR|nr:hypothetical protein GGX14DRAFT_635350 [Mycena pura]